MARASPSREWPEILARKSLRCGDLAGVRSALAGAWGLSEKASESEILPHVVLTALRAETALVDHNRADSHDESLALVSRILTTAQQLHRPGERGAAWWAETNAHARRSTRSDNPADWARAVELWRSCAQPYDAAQCLHRQAETELSTGDIESARVSLNGAYDTYSELRAAPLSLEAAALARRARIPLHNQIAATPPAKVGLLTQREVEVLVLVSEGRTNAEIAKYLYMSPKTASVHVSRILSKLGATNRTEAVALARVLGLSS